MPEPAVLGAGHRPPQPPGRPSAPRLPCVPAEVATGPGHPQEPCTSAGGAGREEGLHPNLYQHPPNHPTLTPSPSANAASRHRSSCHSDILPSHPLPVPRGGSGGGVGEGGGGGAPREAQPLLREFRGQPSPQASPGSEGPARCTGSRCCHSCAGAGQVRKQWGGFVRSGGRRGGGKGSGTTACGHSLRDPQPRGWQGPRSRLCGSARASPCAVLGASWGPAGGGGAPPGSPLVIIPRPTCFPTKALALALPPPTPGSWVARPAVDSPHHTPGPSWTPCLLGSGDPRSGTRVNALGSGSDLDVSREPHGAPSFTQLNQGSAHLKGGKFDPRMGLF